MPLDDTACRKIRLSIATNPENMAILSVLNGCGVTISEGGDWFGNEGTVTLEELCRMDDEARNLAGDEAEFKEQLCSKLAELTHTLSSRTGSKKATMSRWAVSLRSLLRNRTNDKGVATERAAKSQDVVAFPSNAAGQGPSPDAVGERATEASSSAVDNLREIQVPIQSGAVWKDMPAREPWCPDVIAQHYPALAQHCYQDHISEESNGFGHWKVVGATRRGKMHANEGSHREDAFKFAICDDYAILCLADGAGSQKFSRLGSHVSCESVVGHCEQSLRRDLDSLETKDLGEVKAVLTSMVIRAVQGACEELRQMANKAGCREQDFRTTLLLAILVLTKRGKFLAISQIGDGAVCLLKADGTVCQICQADSGEFSGQVTCFVPDSNAVVKASEVHHLDATDIQCVLLCSDGVDDPFYPLKMSGVALFRQLYLGVQESIPEFRQAPQNPILSDQSPSAALLKWLEFWKRGENDDRTVVVMYSWPPAFELSTVFALPPRA